jgi:hypothetical protein
MTEKDGERVQDDGSVDQRIKDRILDSRERVEEMEPQIYVEGALSPSTNLSEAELDHIYATLVRQYLRNIEPVLKSDSVEQAQFYYREKEIVTETIRPPESDGVDWAAFAMADDPVPLMRELGFSPDFEPPEPKTVEYRGLLDVIEKEQVTLSWTIVERPGAAPPNQSVTRLTRTWRPNQKVLNRAVRIADEFLQNAGIGLEIGSGRDFNNYSE